MGEKHEALQRNEWTLRYNGITVHTGELIEFYGPTRQKHIATVRHVIVVGLTAFGRYEGEQVVYAQLYSLQPSGRIPKSKQREFSVSASDVIRTLNLDQLPVPPRQLAELLYPKHHFHRLSKGGKMHVVRDEVTPLWGGPDVDWGKKTLCGLPNDQRQHLEERTLDREQICETCLRNVRLFRLPADDWRRRSPYLREYLEHSSH